MECVKRDSIIIYELFHVSGRIFLQTIFAQMYIMIHFIFYTIAANFSCIQFVVCTLFYEHNILPVCILYTLF
jgi:hypothetical protein